MRGIFSAYSKLLLFSGGIFMVGHFAPDFNLSLCIHTYWNYLLLFFFLQGFFVSTLLHYGKQQNRELLMHCWSLSTIFRLLTTLVFAYFVLNELHDHRLCLLGNLFFMYCSFLAFEAISVMGVKIT